MENRHEPQRPLSVIIPVHNEAACLRGTLQELYDKCLSHLRDFELIVLEDGSTDGTADALRECESAFPNLKAVIEPKRHGYRTMVTRAIMLATKEWILLMDGDGQIEPADIWNLLRCPEDYDIVSAIKLPRCDPMIRIFVSRVFDSVSDLVLGVSIRDINFGFKVMRTSAAQKLAPQCGKLGELYTAELAIRFIYAGCRMEQIRVRHRRRSAGTSTGIPRLQIIERCWTAFTGLFALRREFVSAQKKP